MKFIKATLEDFDIVKNIVHSTIKTIYPHYYPMGVIEFFLKHHSDLNIRKGIETETVLLMEVDGVVVGTGSTYENEIGRMFVLPEFQGLGYGTSLMKELEDIIAKEYSKILLHSSLPAYNLYIKRGYVTVKYEKIITPNEDVLCFNIMEKPVGHNIEKVKCLNMERFNKQLEFLIEIDKLKHILRNTILMDATRMENDSEHTWHMAVCAMLLSEYSNEQNLNMLKVLKMILLHDIVEIDAGDTFAYDEKGHLDKEVRENRAADRIFGLLPKDQEAEFRELWKEFEEYRSPEAKFAVAIDSFMPFLHNYVTKGLQWQRLGVTSDKVLERNKLRVESGSKVLYEYIETIVKEAVNKGYLKAE